MTNLGHRLGLELEPILAHAIELTADEQRDAARAYRAGDAGARDRLVLSCLKLAARVAWRFYRLGLSPELGDYFQEACRGLVQAVETYDSDRAAFTTHAQPWCRQACRRLVFKDRTVAAPYGLGTIAAADAATGRAVSLDVFYADPIAATEAPELAMVAAEVAAEVGRRLDLLPPRWAQAVRLYHGIDGPPAGSLRAVGLRMRLSAPRVRQLLVKARRRMAAMGAVA